MTDISPARVYALRLFYLLCTVGGGLTFWPSLLNPSRPLGLFDGVAFSFWSTLMLLMAVGLRYPLQMLPLVLLQLSYKTAWLLAVALPLWSADRLEGNLIGTTKTFAVVVVVDLLVMPWGYLWRNYVTKPGDSWALAGVRRNT